MNETVKLTFRRNWGYNWDIMQVSSGWVGQKNWGDSPKVAIVDGEHDDN
jgi:hypothetical protein